MSLPKIQLPTYDLILPSTKQLIKYRPFTVKENKIFLTAIAVNSKDQLINATKQVISNCLLTSGINVDSLPIYDIEYLTLRLRSVSVSNVLKLEFKGDKDSECDYCKLPKKLEIDLNEIEVVFPENREYRIQLNEQIGVILKDPTYDVMKYVGDEKEAIENQSKFIAQCIDKIYDKENVYDAKENSEQELVDFVESLSISEFQKLEHFFDTLPRLEKEINLTCPKCSKKSFYKLQGIEDFLD